MPPAPAGARLGMRYDPVMVLLLVLLLAPAMTADAARPGCSDADADGWTDCDGDCDDADPTFHPGAPEPDCTDPADYNCDGATGYLDADGDGWPTCLDCNDGASAVSPGATEACNDLDDDCDGAIDESSATGARTWYRDADGDGFGDTTHTRTACDLRDGYTDVIGDCDDANPAVYPGAPEVWYDGVDQDCDGQDDDRDGDGFGIAKDCDDLDPQTYPGAPGDLWYDGVDTDCALNSDFDADGDGFDATTFGGSDCDDADPDTWPGAPDTPYDGVVTDCDGADEQDADGDGYAVPGAGGDDSGEDSDDDSDDDCDDANASVHPGAEETWYDGVDQDCDGTDNDQDGDAVPFETDCDDTDPAVGNCYLDTPDTGEAGATGALVPSAGAVQACGCAGGVGPGGASPGGIGLLLLGMLSLRRRFSAANVASSTR